MLIQESNSVRETYQLQCALTGRVKMYKRMSEAAAQALDGVLRDHQSTYRWVRQHETASSRHGSR